MEDRIGRSLGHRLDVCSNGEQVCRDILLLFIWSEFPLWEDICASFLCSGQCTIRECFTMAGIGNEVVALLLDEETPYSHQCPQPAEDGEGVDKMPLVSRD